MAEGKSRMEIRFEDFESEIGDEIRDKDIEELDDQTFFAALSIELENENKTISFRIVDFLEIWFQSLLMSATDNREGKETKVESHDDPSYIKFVPEGEKINIKYSGVGDDSPIKEITLDRDTVQEEIQDSAENFLEKLREANPDIEEYHHFKNVRTYLEDAQRLINE